MNYCFINGNVYIVIVVLTFCCIVLLCMCVLVGYCGVVHFNTVILYICFTA